MKTNREKEIKKEMKSLEREIKSIYKIAMFLTDIQLAPYKMMANKYYELRKELEIMKYER